MLNIVFLVGKHNIMRYLSIIYHNIKSCIITINSILAYLMKWYTEIMDKIAQKCQNILKSCKELKCYKTNGYGHDNLCWQVR